MEGNGKDAKDKKEEYISTIEVAKLFDFHPAYVAKLARKARSEGNIYPIKRGRIWEAPLQEWKRILCPSDKVLRKKRPEIESDFKSSPPDQGISCKKAAGKYGLSQSWAAELATRARKRGYEWPKKIRGQCIAPYEEWVKIFELDNLKTHSRRKK